jgi:plastocyanin
VTIQAGQAVAFANGNNGPHTITEGTLGQAAANACVNVPIAPSETVTVTFYGVGDYPITCKPHPPMQTAVDVK